MILLYSCMTGIILNVISKGVKLAINKYICLLWLGIGVFSTCWFSGVFVSGFGAYVFFIFFVICFTYIRVG